MLFRKPLKIYEILIHTIETGGGHNIPTGGPLVPVKYDLFRQYFGRIPVRTYNIMTKTI